MSLACYAAGFHPTPWRRCNGKSDCEVKNSKSRESKSWIASSRSFFSVALSRVFPFPLLFSLCVYFVRPALGFWPLSRFWKSNDVEKRRGKASETESREWVESHNPKLPQASNEFPFYNYKTLRCYEPLHNFEYLLSTLARSLSSFLLVQRLQCLLRGSLVTWFMSLLLRSVNF